MKHPGVKVEVARIERKESVVLDALLKASGAKEVGLQERSLGDDQVDA
jgi:hypothetical protein